MPEEKMKLLTLIYVAATNLGSCWRKKGVNLNLGEQRERKNGVEFELKWCWLGVAEDIEARTFN